MATVALIRKIPGAAGGARTELVATELFDTTEGADAFVDTFNKANARKTNLHTYIYARTIKSLRDVKLQTEQRQIKLHI